jgi:transcriptional regulator with XRE-family HTH domain
VTARLEEVLARRLREVAERKGVALTHLADRAGIARSYLWRLLDGDSSATLTTVQRLASVLGVDAVSLLQPMQARSAESAATRPSARRGKRGRPTRRRS